jgi:hypothetical protein
VETAVLDACVLVNSGVRDFLLWVAEAGAFSPVWSDLIHEEWMTTRRERLGAPPDRLIYARIQMELAFPGANFAPDPDALGTIVLPDKNDVHVVATAVAAQATTIITYNTRHFPHPVLDPLGIRSETPDDFCARLFPNAELDVIEGARLHRASLKRPPYDVDPYLDYVHGKLGLNRTAAFLRKARNFI